MDRTEVRAHRRVASNRPEGFRTAYGRGGGLCIGRFNDNYYLTLRRVARR